MARALLRRRAVRLHRERLVVAARLVVGPDDGGCLSSSSRTSEDGRAAAEGASRSITVITFHFSYYTLPHGQTALFTF